MHAGYSKSERCDCQPAHFFVAPKLSCCGNDMRILVQHWRTKSSRKTLLFAGMDRWRNKPIDAYALWENWNDPRVLDRD